LLFKPAYAAAAISVYPGYSNPSAPTGNGCPAAQAFFPLPFVTSNDASWDIAVLRLQQPLTNAPTMKLKGIAQESDLPTESTVAGYPGGYVMCSDTYPHAGVNIRDHVLAYVHDTAPGVSGAPVFNPKTGEVYAIHRGRSLNEAQTEVTEVKVAPLITRATATFIQAAGTYGGPSRDFLVPLNGRN
jgi:V8-like Glu-specific endopeptidase